MARRIGTKLVSHLPDFLAKDGQVPVASSQAKWLGLQLVRIVEAATVHPAGSSVETAIACARRPGNVPCSGRLVVERPGSSTGIHWSCPRCGDNGVITGWSDTYFDLTRSTSQPGEPVYTIDMEAKPYQFLLREKLRADPLRRLVAEATNVHGKARLRGGQEQVSLLQQHLAGELPKARSPQRQFILRMAINALTALPDGAQAPSSILPIQLCIDEKMVPLLLSQKMGLGAARIQSPDEVLRLKELIDDALSVREIRSLETFTLSLDSVLAIVGRMARRDATHAIEAFAYFIRSMKRVSEKVERIRPPRRRARAKRWTQTHQQQHEHEVMSFCTTLCCEALSLASESEAPASQNAELIAAMLAAYSRDTQAWFECVPDLIQAIEVYPDGPDWLSRLIRDSMPAQVYQHQLKLEWMARSRGRIKDAYR